LDSSDDLFCFPNLNFEMSGAAVGVEEDEEEDVMRKIKIGEDKWRGISCLLRGVYELAGFCNLTKIR